MKEDDKRPKNKGRGISRKTFLRYSGLGLLHFTFLNGLAQRASASSHTCTTATPDACYPFKGVPDYCVATNPDQCRTWAGDGDQCAPKYGRNDTCTPPRDP